MIRMSAAMVGVALLSSTAAAQDAGTAPAVPAAAPAAQVAAAGGTIRGTVKAGPVPLPGVAITATNTLTGKKYATTTDVDGNYAMTIPRTGRYVVRAEFAAFATVTSEVRLTAEAMNGTAAFALELASRAAKADATAGNAALAGIASALARGTQSLSVAGEGGLSDASADGGAGATPSLAGLGAESSGAGNDSVAISGQQGQTNALAGLSEDQIRDRIEEAVANARQNGGSTSDQTGAIVSMLGGILGGGGGGFGGLGGPGGGRGGRGGGGGGSFRGFNASQPHGSVFYQGGNSALDSAPWSPTLLPQVNPSAYQNRFGITLAGSPYVPGLFKADTRQFVFLNLTGQKSLNSFLPDPVRVPTPLERTGDFSQSFQRVNNALVPVQLYNPVKGVAIPGNKVTITPQAAALLNFYPQPNVNIGNPDPTVYNYQTISNAGSNNIAINGRYVRQLGANTGGSPFGGGRTRGNSNAPAVLRQNINASYNFSHSASDLRNIFLPLGGATASNGNALSLGYVASYGRLSNNATLSWNRSAAETRNYFTNTNNDPSGTVGLTVPNNTGGFADPRFYNGLPTFAITNFATLTNQTPSAVTNQTISFSDFVAYRHHKHNYRIGLDIRRVHADNIGGDDPLGQYTFTGQLTSSPADKAAGTGGQTSGAGFADFLLGLPTSTKLQAGLFKIYLRENVYDAYAQDDFRVLPNLTLNYGLRYEYFAPYTEKNNRLVNLDHNANFTAVTPVTPGQTGPYQGAFPTSLINPDRTMFSPRLGFAYRPPNKGLTKDTVIRGGYGTNFNTGQFATFAHSLSFQPPFASVQTNVVSQCPTITLANGFNCAAPYPVENNFAVDKNYRLGMVQTYNLNIQRSIPQQIVLNIGYNGSKGSNLDVQGSPNSTPGGDLLATAAPFTFQQSVAGSHSNQLVVSAQRRQVKGVALGLTYTYSHTIDNASSVGGTSATTVQNFYRLDLEEANSSFDRRHQSCRETSCSSCRSDQTAPMFNKGGFAFASAGWLRLKRLLQLCKRHLLHTGLLGQRGRGAFWQRLHPAPRPGLFTGNPGRGAARAVLQHRSLCGPRGELLRHGFAQLHRRTGYRGGQHGVFTHRAAGRHALVRGTRFSDERVQHRAVQQHQHGRQLRQLRPGDGRGAACGSCKCRRGTGFDCRGGVRD